MKRKITFRLREPVAIALETMRAHKLRSFLMLFGIILSVSTLIVVVALITGANRYIASRVANMGSNVFLVHQFPLITNAEEFAKAERRNKRISWDDFTALRDESQLAKRVGVEIRTRSQARAGTQTIEDLDVRGVTANIGQMDVEEVASGRYISESDNQHHTMVTLLGAEVAEKLFPNMDPINHTVLLDGLPFQIVGVAKKIGSVLGQTQDNFAYIPIESWLKIFGASDRSLSINIQARSPEWMARTQEEARMIMRARRHLGPKDPDTFGILDSASLMDLWHQITGAIASTMIGVVSVFLVIGGVVIMNVMLASVTERTREIGIRKSLGARQRDILMQFLTESAFMAAMGGALGVLVAYGISWLVAATTSAPMAVPVSAVVLSLFVSTLVGIFFGVHPARKAAKLDPIEALRAEA